MEKVQSIGFIGGGMMAGAILDGMVNRMKKNPTEIFVSERRQERCDELHDMYGVSASTSADSFIGNVDAVLLAVKPQALDAALDEIASKVKSDARIISIVAGVPLARLEKAFPGHPIVRVMPNTPLSVGEGMSAYTFNDAAEAVKDTTAEKIFSSCGKAVKVAESLMDAVTGLSGSGPAYAFLMIDALSDGGVMAGLPRDYARIMAAQTLLGAAKMVLETEKHPDALRDAVTSPAGTTIAGVRVMEQQGVRGALIDAVMAATRRSEELGKLK